MTSSITERRVSGAVIDIDPEAVAAFFAGRAGRVDTDHPLTSVLYQDANPQLAEERDRYERGFALPYLDLAPGHAVLDVACGIGRWAASVLPVTDDYVGVDLTEELVVAARAHWAGTGAQFHAMPADAITLAGLGRTRGFDRVLVAGLLIYLNDDVLRRVLHMLAGVAAPACRIWLREPIGVEQRLTLREFWSEELSQSYSAVYRTRAELGEAIDATLTPAGFSIVAEGDLYPDALNNRAETKQRYFVLERR
jgi:SAM-dependent methyltransferase